MQIEKEYSALQSALLNKAYSTLEDPLNRSIYLLNLEGHDIPEAVTSADPEFLMEIMEINEKVSNIQSGKELESIDSQNESVISDLCQKISDAFHVKDLLLAKSFIVKLKYYVSISDKIKEVKRKQTDNGQYTKT